MPKTLAKVKPEWGATAPIRDTPPEKAAVDRREVNRQKRVKKAQDDRARALQDIGLTSGASRV